MSVLRDLHFVFVPLILLAGALTLIAGVTLIVQRWRLPDSESPTTGTVALFTRIFRILLIVTASLGAVQAAFGGLILLIGQHAPDDQLHFVYGGLVLLAIPVLYVYSDQKRTRRDLIIMTIAVLIVIGAAVRAFMTGGGL